MRNLWNRRQFLQGLGLSIGSTFFLDTEGFASNRNQHVVIIGAGLSGLCCAYELKKRGFSVLLLEAKAHGGGRVLTLRQGLKENQYIELGATRIPDSHHYTIRYAEEFRLPLREFHTEEPARYHIKGKTFLHQEGKPWPHFLQLPHAEKNVGADELMLAYEHLERVGDPFLSSWPSSQVLDDNQMTFSEYLRMKGMSEDGILLTRANNGSEIDSINALYWLMTEYVDQSWKKTYALAGGNDQLPKAFIQKLSNCILYRAPVLALEQKKNKVQVTYEHQGTHQTLFADHVICSLPFPSLQKIHASFSIEKQQAIANLKMMPVSRISMQTRSRFWKQQNMGGLKICRTDTPIERVWDLSHVQEGERGILTAYLQDQNAQMFSNLPTEKQIPWMFSHLRRFLPDCQKQVEKIFSTCWHQDPWIQGGWAFYQKGQMSSIFPIARKREGRIFFCGEHTSPWSGWMQGALESAHRVVSELVG